MCLFLFVVNLNDGLTFHTISPAFGQLFPGAFPYYGRPLKTCSWAFLANLFAVAIIFVSILIVPWFSEAIEKDLHKKLLTKVPQDTVAPESFALSASLPRGNLLTPREKEVAELLLRREEKKHAIDMLSNQTIPKEWALYYKKWIQPRKYDAWKGLLPNSAV